MSPRRRPQSVASILAELSTRPAMNGGFSRLAQQQDEQCERLEKVETVVTAVHAWQTRFDRRFAWFVGAVGTIAVSVVGRGVYDLLIHVLH